MVTKGIYIYAIVPNSYSEDMFESIESRGVYIVPFKNLFAIVSDRNGTQLDQLDRQTLGYLLVHHQKRIEYFQEVGFSMLLPMQFGTIVSSKEEVCKILENGYDLIMTTLHKIDCLTEINVVANWADFPRTLEMVSTHSDIMAKKKELMEKSSEPTQVEQVAIGMLVQEKLIDKNSKVELNILDSLSSSCLDIRTHEAMSDEMVVNAAFLINKNKQKKFEDIIDQLDEDYKGWLNFKLIGPLPCYSFYTIEVKELNQVQVAQAKKELGLTEETSQVEIKKAYQEKAKEFHPDANQNNNNEENFNKINKAYHTLLEYSEAARQTSKEYLTSLGNEKVAENLILVKIKE